ncbi:hypothetical protein OG730_26735 [Streptomyces sp. NBC_01298]|uniref:hypothetical protein n=1 Tax=Streptomyces sp. NBC_01298 TaxID=2903817 RepID=UPI002E0F5841|nr:hypothetical protein OG730_26735 [Streptomyces sp. NBC_01298]
MSFEQQWAQQRQSAPAPGTGVLGTAPPAKKKAADTIENVLQPGTTKAADAADEPTTTAVRAFAGWETATGLTKAHTHWDDQVKRLMGRLSSEKTALRGASNLFTGNDQLTGQGFQPVTSKLAGL